MPGAGLAGAVERRSRFFLGNWMAGVTQEPHEHCAPVHLKEPRRAPQLLFGHVSFSSPSLACRFIHREGSARKMDAHTPFEVMPLDFRRWKPCVAASWSSISVCANTTRLHILHVYTTSPSPFSAASWLAAA